jgi:hypothetical protein
VIVAGALTATEAGDTVAVMGDVVVQGALAATEAGDTLAATGCVVVAGAVATAEVGRIDKTNAPLPLHVGSGAGRTTSTSSAAPRSLVSALTWRPTSASRWSSGTENEFRSPATNVG